MKTLEIQTPVRADQGYPSEFTKFGVIESINGNKATVLWIAEEIMHRPIFGRRMNRRSTMKLSSLSEWSEETRIKLLSEPITITASGMEYRTPKQ